MKTPKSPGGPRGSGTSAPIRIYVLWHPCFERGETIANEIYRWFRLENMEGIPVFFRSAPAANAEMPPEIGDDCQLNYLLPLVEAHMVADPSWRQYVLRLAERSDIRPFPVALDPLAFQMPAKLRGLNFIRHHVPTPTPQSIQVLLGHLTEILCRDLLGLETPSHPTLAAKGSAAPTKVKLFLSHAKADGTEVPVRLKEYIQTHTQCETFFDETDIASGHDYAAILEDAIRHESAGMITIQGDHYAERPWCRREIRRFQRPWPEPVHGPVANAAKAFFIPPLVVVQNMSGKRISRTIPELGQAPCLQWTDGGERAIVTTLLREVLLGLFYRRLAREACGRYPVDALVVNRAPDPVMMQQLVNYPSVGRSPIQVLYPGYGLSQLEKDGLKDSFPGIQFRCLSESDVEADSLPLLAGKVLRLGVGNATDILSGGLSDDHNRELLIRVLRPLCRERVSILYGGALPRPEYAPRVNFTEACLHLLLSERSSSDTKGDQTARLYSTPAWPASESVTERTIAEWTDVCSFHRVLPRAIGLPVPPPIPPDPVLDPADYPTGAERRRFLARHAKRRDAIALSHGVTQARCLTFMRGRCCGPIAFPIADRVNDVDKEISIQAFAHLFLGGRLEKVSGVAPGLFEEILYALEARQPVFLMGAGYGATGAVCRWLLDPPVRRPRELTPGHYLADPAVARLHRELSKRRSSRKGSAGPITLPDVLDRLWRIVGAARRSRDLGRLLNNGLSNNENRRLLESNTGYGEICRLVWKGLVRVCRPE